MHSLLLGLEISGTHFAFDRRSMRKQIEAYFGACYQRIRLIPEYRRYANCMEHTLAREGVAKKHCSSISGRREEVPGQARNCITKDSQGSFPLVY